MIFADFSREKILKKNPSITVVNKSLVRNDVPSGCAIEIFVCTVCTRYARFLDRLLLFLVVKYKVEAMQ